MIIEYDLHVLPEGGGRGGERIRLVGATTFHETLLDMNECSELCFEMRAEIEGTQRQPRRCLLGI